MECRILECGNCKITQGCSSSHIANDIVAVKNGKNTTDYVVAHSDGKVIAIQKGQKNNPGSTGMASYGNYVQIQHNNGYTTFYAHLDSVSVKVGQAVKKGQRIGYMGNTGNSYGAHTHFEVRKNSLYSSRIDPTKYLDADLPGNYSVIYRVGNGHWYATVSDGATAGNQLTRIDRFQLKTVGGGNSGIRAHIKGGAWLSEVNKWDGSDNGYAGIYGKSIDGIMIKSQYGHIKYRVKCKKYGWLPWVDGYSTKDNINGYAGMLGYEITAIQVKYV